MIQVTLNVGLMKLRKGFIPVAGMESRRRIDTIALLKREEEQAHRRQSPTSRKLTRTHLLPGRMIIPEGDHKETEPFSS